MYKKSTLILLFAVSLLTACKDKKEEACVAPAVEKNIVGAWQVFSKETGGASEGPYKLSFAADGKITGDKDELAAFAGEDAGTALTLKWKKATGNAIELIYITDVGDFGFEMNVTKNECDLIVLDSGLGVTIELKK